MSREIVEVYADWQPIEAPLLIGLLDLQRFKPRWRI